MDVPRFLLESAKDRPQKTPLLSCFCFCVRFFSPFVSEDEELAKSPSDSEKKIKTILTNTGKGLSLFCPVPGTAEKGSGTTSV